MGKYKEIVDIDYTAILIAIEGYIRYCPDRASSAFFPLVSRMVEVSKQITLEVSRYEKDREAESKKILEERIKKFLIPAGVGADGGAPGRDRIDEIGDGRFEKKLDNGKVDDGNCDNIREVGETDSRERIENIEDFF